MYGALYVPFSLRLIAPGGLYHRKEDKATVILLIQLGCACDETQTHIPCLVPKHR